MSRALEIIARYDRVHWYACCDCGDQLVLCPKAFHVSDVSLYVGRVYRRCYQGSSYYSCYVSNDTLVISHHDSANVCQCKKDIFSFLCIEVMFMEFWFFCMPFSCHAFCSVLTERHTIRKP